MNLGVCAILWVGGIQVNVGELTQGQVMAFVNYMTQTLTSIVYVANLVVVFTKASASASRINEVLNCEPSITDEDNEPVALPQAPATDVDAPVSALGLSHTSFSFGAGAANAVNDVTLELPLGKTLGIIGGTGSGKSTLVSLIPRLYDASTGSVSCAACTIVSRCPAKSSPTQSSTARLRVISSPSRFTKVRASACARTMRASRTRNAPTASLRRRVRCAPQWKSLPRSRASARM